MKQKHKEAWLKAKQAWFDKLPRSAQEAMTRPGSVKTK